MQSRVSTMRTSEAERQRVAELLPDTCVEGRLSPEELEERLDQLFAGSTVADIAVLVGDLPGGSAVIPPLRRTAGARRLAPASVPVRRRRGRSPAVPVGGFLVLAGVLWLALAPLPPLIAVLLGAILLSVALAIGVVAVASARVGLALFGIAWIVHRVFRGQHPPAWPGPRMRRW